MAYDAEFLFYLMVDVHLVLASLCAVGAFLLLLVPLQKIYRAYMHQNPLGKRTVKRLTRCSPQVLQRAVLKQEKLHALLAQVMTRVCEFGEVTPSLRTDLGFLGFLGLPR